MKRGGVRIIGGALQGQRLEVPSGARPTESRVREALFSIWGADLPGCRFLDLFAGSGAMGLEALSRGATSSTFVESSKSSLAALRRNCRIADRDAVRLVSIRLPKIGRRLGTQPFGLAFADPPYDFAAYGPLLEALRPCVAKDGELVIEHSSRSTMPDDEAWQHADTRRYGESCLSFFRPDVASEDA